MNEDNLCDRCPAKPGNEKDECCPCQKCGSEITRFVARDSGKSWINKHEDPNKRIQEAVIWRCLDCGNVYTVDPGIKCCDEIEMAICRARGLADINDGWDGGNGKKILETTIDRAGNRMKKIIAAAKDRAGMEIGVASFFPGHDGNVELLWNRDEFILSIDVPENESDDTTYFGSDRGEATIKGGRTLDNVISELVSWFKKIVENGDKMTPWVPL
jgi:hypothetical protein